MADGAAASARHSRPVVLLVDDDAAIRRTLSVGLELEGFEIVCASIPWAASTISSAPSHAAIARLTS